MSSDPTDPSGDISIDEDDTVDVDTNYDHEFV